VEVSAPSEFIIHIENKIYSDEGVNQPQREWEDLQRRAHELGINNRANVHGLFLTLDGHRSTNPEKFRAISWRQIADVLDEFRSSTRPSIARWPKKKPRAGCRNCSPIGIWKKTKWAGCFNPEICDDLASRPILSAALCLRLRHRRDAFFNVGVEVTRLIIFFHHQNEPPHVVAYRFLTPHRPPSQSARGLAHSKTLRAFVSCGQTPRVLDCGGPPPLCPRTLTRIQSV
jgi:hypothetical protein